MKKEYSYLVAGRLLVDLLAEKGIVYNKEDLRRFNIGLLNTLSSKKKPHFKFIKISKPYYMGYYFQIWIDKKIRKNPNKYSDISGGICSQHNEHEREFMRKYKLFFP